MDEPPATLTHTHTQPASQTNRVTHSLTGKLLYERHNVLKLLIRQKDLTTPAGLKQKTIDAYFTHRTAHWSSHTDTRVFSTLTIQKPFPACCASHVCIQAPANTQPSGSNRWRGLYINVAAQRGKKKKEIQSSVDHKYYLSHPLKIHTRGKSTLED